MFLRQVFLAGFRLSRRHGQHQKNEGFDESFITRKARCNCEQLQASGNQTLSADAFLGEAGEPMSDNCPGTLLVVRGQE